MTDPTAYALDAGVATITLDDGKVNALSIQMLAALADRFEQARADEAAVLLTGRERTFSAGFDLKCEPERWPEMLASGAEMAERILSFPRPIVIACNGNAIAMGGFLLLAADLRIGAAGDFRIGLNEVAIGLTIPWFGIALARHRLTRPYYDRCTVTGALLGPMEARDAGFLDVVVEAGELLDRSRAATRELAESTKPEAHAATKLRVRKEVLAGVRDGIERIRGEGREW